MRRIVSSVLSALLLAQSACASGGATTSGAAPVTQTIGGAGVGRVAITTTSDANETELPYDADAVFRILPSVLDSLGVPVNTLDPVRRTIGNNGFKLRQRLGKAVLSTLIECGTSQIGPNADSYDVYMVITTSVKANGTGASTLSTLIDAQARPITYNQAYNRCTTKGTFEQRLATLVTRRLAK